jgi:uncharacterized protein (TIGR02996 family)
VNEEAAFLNRIAESPDDTVTRLVYADWLDERGDSERARYLRIESRWEVPSKAASNDSEWTKRFPNPEEAYPALFRSLTEISGKLDPTWLADVSRIRHHVQELLLPLVARSVIGPNVCCGPTEALIAKCQHSVRVAGAIFEKHLGCETTARNFAVPVDFIAFMLCASETLYFPDPLNLRLLQKLLDAEMMAAATYSLCNTQTEPNSWAAPALPACGLWLNVASREAHDFHLCCDRDSPFFGMVVDQDYFNPWLGPPHGPQGQNVVSRSYFDFLLRIVQNVEQELPPVPLA